MKFEIKNFLQFLIDFLFFSEFSMSWCFFQNFLALRNVAHAVANYIIIYATIYITQKLHYFDVCTVTSTWCTKNPHLWNPPVLKSYHDSGIIDPKRSVNAFENSSTHILPIADTPHSEYQASILSNDITRLLWDNFWIMKILNVGEIQRCAFFIHHV